MYLAPRGTADILPAEQPYWAYVYQCVVEVTTLFGYQRIDVPIFEETELFARGVGQGTDIVDKEMYSFKDKGGRDITLRPEFTAGLMRAYLQHGLRTLPQPVRLYSTGPIFRYERVQAGRYRQHTQFNVECIGEVDPAVDFEVMSVAWSLFSRVGFRDLAFQLNSTGCPACRPDYLRRLVAYYQQHETEICADCHRRLERNPLRLLDCKTPSCQPIIAAAPRIGDYLCGECRAHFEALRGHLDAAGRPYAVNHRLVRGLDYYTKTVFEVWAAGIGAQNAVCGGGRYDGLAEQLGGEHTPGIGFGSGIERLVLAMKEQGIQVPGAPAPQVAVVYVGEEARKRAVQMASDLREAGVRATMAYGDRSMRSQLRAADRDGVPFAVILGDEELANGQATLREMSGENSQVSVPQDEIIPALTRRLRDSTS